MKMPRKTLYPSFQRRVVYKLECSFCDQLVCRRGMAAILLGDSSKRLFSTDFPPENSIQLVDSRYKTEKCDCIIMNFACTRCGNEIGYHVIQPCRQCLDSCNNGHFWMFDNKKVSSAMRSNKTGDSILSWNSLMGCDKYKDDIANANDFTFEECCR